MNQHVFRTEGATARIALREEGHQAVRSLPQLGSRLQTRSSARKAGGCTTLCNRWRRVVWANAMLCAQTDSSDSEKAAV